ncbi:MAG: hypothetical protein AVDCRST_MAG70-627, partial [uncultured Thermomicrobiales bacterium]
WRMSFSPSRGTRPTESGPCAWSASGPKRPASP